MIELLLQADKALSIGALDQAERMYWQSIERDAKNAIAITGLARIALERRDVDTARLFALKALAIDPENAAARRLLDTVRGDEPATEPAASALPMPAIEDLESISRRRLTQAQPEQRFEAEAVEQAGPEETAAEAEAEPWTVAQPAEAAGPVEPSEPADAVEPVDTAEPGASEIATAETDAIEPEPIEAGAASPTLSADDFAAAEAAATLEAIDALDDSVPIEPIRFRHASPPRQRGFRLPSIPHLDATLVPEQRPYEPKPLAPLPPVAPRHAPPERRTPEPPPIVAAPSAPVMRGDGEPTEAEAEAAAFAEAMALMDIDADQVDTLRAAAIAAVEGRVEPVEAVEADPIEAVEVVEADPVKAVEVEPVEGVDVDAVEAEPAEFEAVEPAPVEAEPVEPVEPAEEPADDMAEMMALRLAAIGAVEIEPAEAEPVEPAEPVAVVEAVEAEPVEVEPVEPAPVEAEPPEEPADDIAEMMALRLAAISAVEAEPVEVEPVEPAPVEAAEPVGEGAVSASRDDFTRLRASAVAAVDAWDGKSAAPDESNDEEGEGDEGEGDEGGDAMPDATPNEAPGGRESAAGDQGGPGRQDAPARPPARSGSSPAPARRTAPAKRKKPLIRRILGF